MTKVSGWATQQLGDDAIAEHNKSYKAEWATGEQVDEFVWGNAALRFLWYME